MRKLRHALETLDQLATAIAQECGPDGAALLFLVGEAEDAVRDALAETMSAPTVRVRVR